MHILIVLWACLVSLIECGMNKDRYLAMLRDVRGCLDVSLVESARSVKVLTERRGVLLDALRRCLVSSSVSFYNGGLWWWGGRCYEAVSESEFGNLVYDLIATCGLGPSLLTRVDQFVRVLWRSVAVKELSVDRSMVAFRNCVLDVESGRVRGFGRDVVVFSCLPYDYDPSSRAWRWRQFLDEVLPDEGLQRVLQEFVGALFVDRRKVKLEMMLVLHGSGANGKSVVFEVLRGVLGEGNVSTFPLGSLLGGGVERRRNMAEMNGMRLNYASETDRMVVSRASGALKSLISGEPVEARSRRGSVFTAHDIPLIMMNTNVLPDIRDWSHGMRRRVVILPFDVEIPKWRQDVTLSSSLMDERAGIMNWVLEGRSRFVGNEYRLSSSETLERWSDALMGGGSPILRYMRHEGYQRRSEALRGAVPVWMACRDLYEAYSKWCVVSEEVPESKRTVTMRLREAGWRVVRRGSGTFVALFGDRALRRQTRQLRYERAAAELNAQFRGERHYNARIVREKGERVMEKNSWRRCAVGLSELQDYLGYTFDWRGHINTGKLDGCYVVEDGVYYFDLDSVDTRWRPRYEDGIRSRLLKKAAAAEYEKVMGR